jgi:hypothetical protein
MASVIEICNKALSLLGQKPIVSLEDDSNEAFACRLHWPLLRDEVLEGHRWNCVTTRASLARLSSAPAFGYTYQFQLPSDCLYITRTEPECLFEIEGRKLLTDETEVDIVYTKSEEDSTKYSPQLAAAFSFLLASELAPGMTSSNSEAERLLAIGKDKLDAAMGTDGQQGKRPDQRPSKWISAKYGGN